MASLQIVSKVTGLELLSVGTCVRAVLASLLIWGAALVGCPAAAEEWPARPVKMVVAFPAGGGIDLAARELARKLSESFGQTFFIENRPGASGNLGTEYVAKAAPDGYTLLFGSDIQFTVAPNWESDLPYKISDFAPVSLISDNGLILAAHSSLGVSNLHEMIALARTEPGKINYASNGPGSTQELAMELLQQLGAFKLTEVPYRGGGQSLPDLVAGQIQLGFVSVGGFPYFRDGQLKPLGAGTLQRFEALPDIPTIAEQGFPGFEANIPSGLYVPAGTSADIIASLQQRVARVLATREMHDRFIAMGATAIGSTPEVLSAHIAEQSAKWARIIQTIREREKQ
jgi:tripartite-type tricarboxylate transporter receptor subunit TctC